MMITLCAGSLEHLSLYCSSAEAKARMTASKELQAKDDREKDVYKQYITKTFKDPWEKKELGNGAEVDKVETPEEKAIREANIFGNPFNAPMLVSW